MKVQDFQKFVETLPLPEGHRDTKSNRVDAAILDFVKWSTRLPAKQRRRSPNLRFRYPPGDEIKDETLRGSVGATLDVEKLEFSFMKDLRPDVNYRAF
ncbi:hypothetical protein CC2G_011450 [Coprinopsis cinerea AmutBmut pab1-1]|nr:hypothetical protein CC2G_011450 [Coprinopsis cinerea AmutBmut pab1-1]